METLQPDPRAALAFYGALLGWAFSGDGPTFVAELDGLSVAGVGALPPGGPPAALWNTHVRVDDAGAAAARAASAGGGLLIGPLDVPGAGRFAVLVDPAGAAFSVWEARGREGAQRVNEPGAWAMSSLHTPDPAAAGSFYATLFGWQAEPLGPVTLLRLPGYAGEPAQPIPPDTVAVMTATDPAAPVPPHWNVNLRVADADAIAAHAAELGAAVLMPPTDTPGFRSAVIQDPQGAVFSVSRPAPGSTPAAPDAGTA